jgi:hypothetical protein
MVGAGEGRHGGHEADPVLRGMDRYGGGRAKLGGGIGTSAPSGEVSPMLTSPGTFAVASASPCREPGVRDAPQRTL